MEENHDRGSLLIGALGAVFFLAILLISRHLREDEQTPMQAAEIGEPAPPAVPIQAPSPILTEQAQRPSGTLVYECFENSQRVFSDSPCGEGATTRTIGPVNLMDAPLPLHRSSTERAPAAARRAPSSPESSDRDCTDYEEAVRRIDAVMRRGYTSAEGEHLRAERLRKARLRDDCYRDNRLK